MKPTLTVLAKEFTAQNLILSFVSCGLEKLIKPSNKTAREILSLRYQY
jgi:hypothetical protein|tara:strand:- start:1491 stop:1634 length:144 start_codon:yes stop_codon:yes gene_type:complete